MAPNETTLYRFESYPHPTPTATFDDKYVYLDQGKEDARKAKVKQDFQKFVRTKGKREWDY